MNPALNFEPDAYMLEGHQMMGRRAAGSAFLRAVVEGRNGDPVIGYTAQEETFRSFAAMIKRIDPAAIPQWVPADRLRLLPQVGLVHRPDITLAALARLRLRTGPASFAITGITHTLSTINAQEQIARLLIEPVMPWDALICTSSVARAVVESIFERERDYQRWRLGTADLPPAPQLPVIPLGVHSDDFASSDLRRMKARIKFGIGSDDVALLFAGRLSVSGKAHPFQMYDALRRIAEATGKPIVLIHAGQFFSDAAETVFRDAAAAFAPGVRIVFADGAQQDSYDGAFAAADIFISLSDSIQETFGLTPVEAMAAGLPVIVSDWNGYKDTVRDGIDGFRIDCWAPGPACGVAMTAAYEVGTNGYDLHMSRTSTPVSMDDAQLVERLTDLIGNAELRRRMGDAGRTRARNDYDWAVVYRRYRELWTELDAIRRHAQADPARAAWLAQAPPAHPVHANVWERFAGYSTWAIAPETRVRLAPDADIAAYQRIAGRQIFALWRIDATLLGHIFAALADGDATVADIARAAGIGIDPAIEHIGRLAKMNLLILARD